MEAAARRSRERHGRDSPEEPYEVLGWKVESTPSSKRRWRPHLRNMGQLISSGELGQPVSSEEL